MYKDGGDLSYRVGKIVCARLGLWSDGTESGLT